MNNDEIVLPSGDDLPDPPLRVEVDPDGMRADGCDDVTVIGYVRPLHGHATTGKVHAHPGGQLAHMHQTAEQVAALAGATIHRAPEVGSTLPQRMAHLLVRSTMALGYEGIGPMGDEDTDPATLTEAVALVRADFNDHELWDHRLLTNHEHPAEGCDFCASTGGRFPLGLRP